MNYREACNGILFSHELTPRGETIVTRKITQAMVAADVQTPERASLFWAAGYEGIEPEFMGKELEAVGIVVNTREPCQATIEYQAVST